jgi:hypothetical protein
MLQSENSKDWAFQGNTGTDPITQAFSLGGFPNGQLQPEWSVLNGMPWSDLQVICAPPQTSCLN